MTEGEARGGVDALITRFQNVLRIVEIARERGELEGKLTAYADICDQICKALASCEDELTRLPGHPIVLGQVLALTKLAAHFSPVPACYEQSIEEQAKKETPAIERMIASLLEISREHKPPPTTH